MTSIVYIRNVSAAEDLSVLEIPIYLYSRMRVAHFFLQYFLMNSIASKLPGLAPPELEIDSKTLGHIDKALLDALKEDARNIREGIYPLSVLTPESPLKHLFRIPKIIGDAFFLYRRRQKGKTSDFSGEAKELVTDLPAYYRRNFHFQTNGYLSQDSAELYDHQVEILFAGAADVMRRLILPPFKKAINSADGHGLTFLELGAGTGRATRLVKLAFPKAKIVATDLSDPYLKVASQKLSRFSNIDYLRADAAHLPFRDHCFDAVYSVYLFHELPLHVRKKVLGEAGRVLKPGGFLGLVDSMQTGDSEQLGPLLEKFPENFHEPFYKNYIAHPLEGLLKEQGFSNIQSKIGFYAKACWGKN